MTRGFDSPPHNYLLLNICQSLDENCKLKYTNVRLLTNWIKFFENDLSYAQKPRFFNVQICQTDLFINP